MVNKVGFEYLNKNGKTVFETFLKYTDEKKNSSKVLARIFKKLFSKEGMTFLDVGAGNGEFLRMSLSRIRRIKKVNFILLEPSDDLVGQLKFMIKFYPLNSNIKIVNSTFDDFSAENKFDFILASHPPFRKENLYAIFERMLGLLRFKGYLIVILRQKDEAYEFRTKFKSQLMGEKDYQALSVDDAIKILSDFAKTNSLEISVFNSNSKLCIPIEDNMKDAISIIEFYLNKKWEEFPLDIREAVLDYIKQKKGILHQTDGFVLVRKL